jgi:PIN domain nuclease of toxin-antitoxin system
LSLLLDTHIALWLLARSDLLTEREKITITEHEAALFVSVVSLWETAIKRSSPHPRSDMPPLSAELMERGLTASGVKILPVIPRHAIFVESLPSSHKDPFDRMIAAQALAEPMRVLSRDAAVLQYLPVELRQ